MYKQADMGFAAEAGLFFWGGMGRFAPKKGVTLHPRAMDFREKKEVFLGGGERGLFALKKGCNASSIHGLQISKKKKSSASSIKIFTF